MACDQELSPADEGKRSDQIAILFEVDKQPNRFAVAAAARKLGGVNGVETAIGREDQTLRRRFGRKCEFQSVVSFEGDV